MRFETPVELGVSPKHFFEDDDESSVQSVHAENNDRAIAASRGSSRVAAAQAQRTLDARSSIHSCDNTIFFFFELVL